MNGEKHDYKSWTSNAIFNNGDMRRDSVIPDSLPIQQLRFYAKWVLTENSTQIQPTKQSTPIFASAKTYWLVDNKGREIGITLEKYLPPFFSSFNNLYSPPSLSPSLSLSHPKPNLSPIYLNIIPSHHPSLSVCLSFYQPIPPSDAP